MLLWLEGYDRPRETDLQADYPPARRSRSQAHDMLSKTVIVVLKSGS